MCLAIYTFPLSIDGFFYLRFSQSPSPVSFEPSPCILLNSRSDDLIINPFPLSPQRHHAKHPRLRPPHRVRRQAGFLYCRCRRDRAKKRCAPAHRRTHQTPSNRHPRRQRPRHGTSRAERFERRPARPPSAERKNHRCHVRRFAPDCRPARPRRRNGRIPHPRKRPANRQNARTAGRCRHHLRIPTQRNRRCRRPLPQVRQRLRPARRQRSLQQQYGALQTDYAGVS